MVSANKVIESFTKHKPQLHSNLENAWEMK